MIARLTVFAVLVLSLATYASSPAPKASSNISGNSPVLCCDGDPNGPIGH